MSSRSLRAFVRSCLITEAAAQPVVSGPIDDQGRVIQRATTSDGSDVVAIARTPFDVVVYRGLDDDRWQACSAATLSPADARAFMTEIVPQLHIAAMCAYLKVAIQLARREPVTAVGVFRLMNEE